jgi:hypothetical protein
MAGVIFGCRGRGIGSPRLVLLAPFVGVTSSPVVVLDAKAFPPVMLEKWDKAEADVTTGEGVSDSLAFVVVSLDCGLERPVEVPVKDVGERTSIEEALFCLGSRACCAVAVDMASEERNTGRSFIAICDGKSYDLKSCAVPERKHEGREVSLSLAGCCADRLEIVRSTQPKVKTSVRRKTQVLKEGIEQGYPMSERTLFCQVLLLDSRIMRTEIWRTR